MRRPAVALLAPTARTVPWAPLAAGAALGLTMVALPAVFSQEPGLALVVTLLRVSALSGALGAAFLLDDPARHTTAAVPVPRLLRQVLRVGLVLPAAALWWVAVLGVARATLPPGRREGLPLGALTVEAAALLAFALALGAGAVRWGSGLPPSALAAPGVLALVVAVAVLPERFALLVQVGHSRWAEAHQWWAGLLAAAALAHLALGLQPTGRRLVRVSGGSGGPRASGAAGSP